MDSDSYLQIRNYISKILRESILKEGATGSALAAKVARVLIDICVDNYADTGLLFLKYYTGDVNEKAYRAFYIKGREVKLLGDDRHGSGLIRMRSWGQSFPVTAGVYLPDDLRYHGRAARSYIEYRGDVCIVSTGMMEKYKINHHDIHSAVRELADNKEIQKLKRAGEEFLSHVQSEEDRKQLIKSFGSVSAIGYFAAIFAVVIPAGGSRGALGHVSGQTADNPFHGQVLTFRENRMTVSDPDFVQEIRNQLPDTSTRATGSGQTPLYTTMEKSVQIGSALRSLAATNTTYIHELQHLIQHAVYQTPTKHAQNIEMASDDPDRYHPFNVYQVASNPAVIQGMIKSRRPSAQQIEIMSELLAAGNVIDPQEKRVSGVNSPLFDYIGPVSEGSSGDGARLHMKLESVWQGDTNLEESWRLTVYGFNFSTTILNQLNFILSGIPNKKKPDERKSQLDRFGSAKGKKAVGRKYRFFLADAFENADMAKRIAKFDPSDADSKGPEEIKKRLPPDEDGEVTPLERDMAKYLANKGGRLTQSAFRKVSNGMPTLAIYLAALDISFTVTGSGHTKQINIPLPWLKNYIDKKLYSEIVDLATSDNFTGILESALIDKIAKELDIKVAITQPKSLVPKSSIPKIAAIAGFTSRVKSGVAEIGAAWYERAANYIWPQMRTEYDAEFTASNGLVLYNLYLLGTGKKEEMPGSLLRKINQNTEPLFRALIDEDIGDVEDAFTNLRPGSSHGMQFLRWIPREERVEKSDQDRRLAIDLIEIAQDISDEELDEIIGSAAMQSDSSAQWPEDSKKFNDVLQKYIDTAAVPSTQYEFLQLFRLEFLGLIGKKFLS